MNKETKENIEAIEREKEEYLEESDEETEEIEFGLSEGEIDEWINELSRLKEEKKQIEFYIDANTLLKINYEEE